MQHDFRDGALVIIELTVGQTNGDNLTKLEVDLAFFLGGRLLWTQAELQ